MVFLLIFLIVIVIITLKIKFEIQDLKLSTKETFHLNKDYQIKIQIYTLGIIPILCFKLNSIKINRILKNKTIEEKINKEKIKLITDKANIDKKLITSIKNIKTEIKEINLKILIGTENASLTAFIIPVISTILAIVLSKQIKKYNDKQVFSIIPIYINQNLINIELSCIFQIKMIHIINTICMVNKKRKGDKNERTSNRRSYDYGYE
mgnify:CR=1 FL=1